MKTRWIEHSQEAIAVRGTDIEVYASSIAPDHRDLIESEHAISTTFGPMRMTLTPAEAIEYGDALIRAAHHYRSHANASFDRAADKEKAA
jgi:hypothetical protein